MDDAISKNPTEAPMVPPPLPKPVLGGRGGFRFRASYGVLGVMLGLPLCGALGVAGYFRLSSATQALRQSVMDSVPGQWDKRFAVHVGGITLGLVRFGAQFLELPPEPKAALSALRGAEVGVYELQQKAVQPDGATLFARADKTMKWRGWERVVGVAQPGQFVAVYMPRHLRSWQRMACSVVVLDHRNLVVVSARGNLEPVLDLANRKLQEHKAELAGFSWR